MKKEELRGRYILAALERHCKGGDAYATSEELFALCQQGQRNLSYDAYQADKTFLLRSGRLHLEGQRLYLTKIWNCEEAAAKALADVCAHNELDEPIMPETMSVTGATLTEEQAAAVRLALSHRLSIITGEAGTGKTTLIQALVKYFPSTLPGFILSAPTGKAAQNLEQRTGYETRTVHSALGMGPDGESFRPVRWPYTGLVVVDEASMLTLELLARLLKAVSRQCRLVLVGDPGQLQAVGAGNVLSDLLALGVPCARLRECHRQDAQAEALVHNVRQFKNIHCFEDFLLGDHFRFLPEPNEARAHGLVCRLAMERYRAGENVQVLAPMNHAGKLSVTALNKTLQGMLNPATEKNSLPDYPKLPFRDGDRVIILENDWGKGVCNGDVGVFHLLPGEELTYCVIFEDGWTAAWSGTDDLKNLALAYAVTIHKAQGSEYDTIILPLVKRQGRMLYRNLLYTAVSRAKKQMILVGDPDAVDMALQREALPRRSMLVTKTRMRMMNAA